MAQAETLYKLFQTAAVRHNAPNALAAKRGGEWVPISHKDMLADVRHISLGLNQLGVTKGDRVALLSESRPEWTLFDLGCHGLTAALVPIYSTLMPDQVAHILSDSGSRVCAVSNSKQLDKVLSLVSDLPALEKIILFDEVAGLDDPRVVTLATLRAIGERVATEHPDLADQLADEGHADDLATLIYTSGTTGKQKGVMLTHANFLSNIFAAFDDTHLINDSDLALSYLPLCHIFERTALYGFLHAGVPIYFATAFDTVADEIREVRPTIMTSVPRMFEKMYEKIREKGARSGRVGSFLFERAMRTGDVYARAAHHGFSLNPLVEIEHRVVGDRVVFDKWREAVGGRIKYFISGGAPLAKDIAYAFFAAGLPIYEGYGLTETSPVISLNIPNSHKIGTVGKPLPNLDVRIAEDGEILVKGPSIMKGYFNLPDATAEAFDDDGYFRTGDIGHIDGEGYLVITDRKKDLLKTSGGKYIAPQPIENALKASNLISQAVVIGDKRKFCSALLVPNFRILREQVKSLGLADATDAELTADPRVIQLYLSTVDKLTPNLARYEKIKKVALLASELTIESGELTPTLKVKRRVVEDKYADVIESLYADGAAKGNEAHG